MKYQSKKHPEVIASLDFKDEKFKTVMLIYLTGPDAGKSVSITESTFKRWWKKYEEPKQLNSDGTITKEEAVVAPAPTSPLDSLGIDYDKVNEPYPEPKEQKYIKKPESVIEYEQHKKRGHGGTPTDIPELEEIVKILQPIIIKVNKDYVKLKDKTNFCRFKNSCTIYAAEGTWQKLTMLGFKFKPSPKSESADRPYVCKLTTKEEFDKVVKALLED